MRIPTAVKVNIVNDEAGLKTMVSELMGSEYVGIDTEGRSMLMKSATDLHRVSIMQLSNKTHSFLVDFLLLGRDPNLDKALCDLFSSQTTIIGFAFVGDLYIFRKFFPHMKFYQYIEKFIDAQLEFSRIHDRNELVSLSRIIEALFDAPLCKIE